MVAIGQASLEFHSSTTVRPTTFWVQALSEAGEDEEVLRFLRVQLREVHDFVADAVRAAQALGGVPADRDADAEAWVYIGASLLVSFADRLGGLVDAEGLAAIARERHRWLTGSS